MKPKFTLSQVRAIRRMAKARFPHSRRRLFPTAFLASKHNVHRSTIYRMLNKETYKKSKLNHDKVSEKYFINSLKLDREMRAEINEHRQNLCPQ